MSEQVIFRNQAFGGFNKEEVLKYIDSLNAKHTEEQTRLDEENRGLSSQITDLKIKTEEGEKSFNELMSAYNEMREHYMMLKTRCDNLESDNAKLKTRCEIAEKELCIEKELNKQLEDKIEQERQKADEHAAEEKRLVAAMTEMGDSARVMLSGAKNNAQSIINDAQASAEGINAEIDSFCKELEKTKAFMQDSLSVLIQRLEYIGKSASAAKIAAEGMKAMVSSAKPSFTNCQNMPLRVAPIAMRRPISALLCCVRYQKVPTTPSRTFSRKKAMPAT